MPTEHTDYTEEIRGGGNADFCPLNTRNDTNEAEESEVFFGGHFVWFVGYPP